MGKARRGCTVDDVRALALALPDTEEKPSYGTPGFRVRDKLFARVLDEESIVVGVDFDQRDLLVASSPEVFQVTPHYQGYPWVIVRLSAATRGLLEDMITSAWRLRAPAKLLAAFDAGAAQPRVSRTRRR